MVTPTIPLMTEERDVHFREYPHPSVWAAHEVAGFRHALRQTRPYGNLNLRVHLPFCGHCCAYCHRPGLPARSRAEVEACVQGILDEFDQLHEQVNLGTRRTVSVRMTGGSPSSLPVASIEHLLRGLAGRLTGPAPEEWVFEADPVTLDEEKIHLLKNLGVTRLVLGVHTLTPDILSAFARAFDEARVKTLIHSARASGIREIVVELLAGLPGETERSWMRSVERVANMAPQGLSLRQMEWSPASGLRRHLEAARGGGTCLPAWPEKRAWIQRAWFRLREYGYRWDGLHPVHGSVPEWRWVQELEEYGQGRDLLALGPGAEGFLAGTLYRNDSTLETYLHRLERRELPLAAAHRLDREEAFVRETLLQLQTGRVKREYFRWKFDRDVDTRFAPQWRALQRQGWLERTPEFLVLRPEARLHLPDILAQFVAAADVVHPSTGVEASSRHACIA